MDRFISKILAIICSIISFTYLCVPVVNAEYESENASITVLLESPEEQQPVAGTDICFYKVADLTNIENHQFIADDKFKDILVSLNFTNTEKTCTYENTIALINWVKDNNIQPDGSKVSDKNGKAVFYGLSNGIYLIDIPNCDKFTVNSFIAEVPLSEAGKLYYNVSASPKLEPPNDSSDNSSDSSSNIISDSSGMDDSGPVYNNDTSGGNVNNTVSRADNSNKSSNSTNDGRNPNTGSLVIRIALIVMLIITLGALAYSKACFKDKKDK